MAKVYYVNKRGTHVMRFIPRDEVVDVIQRLYRQRIEATARDIDTGEVIGEVYKRDFLEPNPVTNRPFQWIWWASPHQGQRQEAR